VLVLCNSCCPQGVRSMILLCKYGGSGLKMVLNGVRSMILLCKYGGSGLKMVLNGWIWGGTVVKRDGVSGG